MSTELVKTRNFPIPLAAALMIGLLTIGAISIPIAIGWEHYYWDAPIVWYDEAAELADASPVLKEDLRKYCEDGILTRHEVLSMRAKYRKLRKDKARRDISEKIK
jgi:hypothetical protein